MLNEETTAREATPLLTPWISGPEHPGDAPVVVSVTEYQAHHRRDIPAVALKGLRMRMGWYAMPGAVGLWLWSVPTAGCSGSVSVWTTTEALDRFIQLPHHIDIMRRYRSRGTVRSTTWTAELFDRDDVLARARDWINRRPA